MRRAQESDVHGYIIDIHKSLSCTYHPSQDTCNHTTYSGSFSGVTATANVKYSASVSGSTSHPRVFVSAAQISSFVPHYKAAKVTVTNGTSSETYQYPASSTGSSSSSGGRRPLRQIGYEWGQVVHDFDYELSHAAYEANVYTYDILGEISILYNLHHVNFLEAATAGPASGRPSCYQF